jgi:pyruvate,water dikinase
MTQAPYQMPASVSKETDLILEFEQIAIQDVPQVGGKNASLGEMIQQLASQGVRVPTGFATTAYAYRDFIFQAGLESQMRSHLESLNTEDLQSLRHCGQSVRSLILETPFPPELEAAITQAYLKLCASSPGYVESDYPTLDVAVRSSATAEDLPDASFAGQQETYLNVHGVQGVLEACHKCFASLFTDRAISYRALRGFDHFEVALSVGVQRMVRSDLATSGVMFSIDTETGFKDVALVTAAYGLGENVVQGAVIPDEYLVFKPTLEQGYRPILKKSLGSKEIKMVYEGGSKLTKNVSVPERDRQQYALSDDEILTLARWASIIENHYSKVRDTYTPMDMEWAKDGLTGELFIVQARPETVQSQKSATVLRSYRLQTNEDAISPIVTGQAVGEMIGQGPARVIQSVDNIADFQPGEVLVTQRTDPDWEPIMKRASAIVTDQGGRTCHAAIIAREMGIPAVVGCSNAIATVQPGSAVTVTCAAGEVGKVYAGSLPFEVKETAIDNLPRTRTQILMNVGNPEEAFRLAAIPCDGVGLARQEFIIANQIKVHPLALLHFDQLEDGKDKRAIAALTQHYIQKSDYFIDRLAYGVATIAAAFYPKPVIIRLSDFKSNEYANLLGGRDFEPSEENPMIGWRGASRYTDPRYREAFTLECIALKRVRDEMGLVNVIPMVPFCRTPEEGRSVLAEMARHGLVKGENGLEVYVMCEIPNNVILAADFAQVFDGFSIGSNDLTQLTLGLDRDSALVAHLFDERNAGVKEIVRMAIERVKQAQRKIGICGQAPSDYPEFAQFLVEQGIDSVSLNPDSVISTTLAIAEIEKDLL